MKKRSLYFFIFPLFLGEFLLCGGWTWEEKCGEILIQSEKNLNLPLGRDLLFPNIPSPWNEEIIGETNKGFLITKSHNMYYVDGYLIANKTYSLPSDYEPQDTFVAIQGKNNCEQCIHTIAYRAFERMKNAAKQEGVSLFIASGYRSYRKQKELYQNYVKRDGKKAADRYSARPWNSEHQTSLAFDLNQVSSEFEYTKAGKWLNANAYKFGFILRYPKGKEKNTWYMYESWHFRYVGTELSYKLWNEGNRISLEEYFGIDSHYPD